MPDIEKTIKNLRAMSNIAANNGDIQSMRTMDDAVDLLESRIPRLMTLRELRFMPTAWQNNTPPYLWFEDKMGRDSRWVRFSEVINMIMIPGTTGCQNYGTVWRVWTLHPTPKQMRETKWEDKAKGEQQ